MNYTEMTAEERAAELAKVRAEYESYAAQGLKLDMSRGKPSAAQLALSEGMLGIMSSAADCFTETGFDCRNYGVLDGIPEAKRIFSDILGIPAANIIVAGNSSLNIMYDELARLMLYGAVGVEKPWAHEENIKFICAVPGYDRHFTICEALGIELVNVDMTPEGPDMDAVEELVRDPSVKGMWCVPKYSNPDGITYSDETVRRFARLAPAAPDFRVFWDEAYIVHSFSEEDDQLLNIFDEAGKCGTLDHFLIFTSTSKITFPGSGVAVMAASDRNIAFTKSKMTYQTIGYDKVNQLRHVLYLQDREHTLALMKRHAAVLAPKFHAVLNALDSEIAPRGIADYKRPVGGYFISVDTMHGCAKRTLELCREAGITMTGAGATFPYGKDPNDSNIRIAPSLPPVAELEQAIAVFCICLRLAALEKLGV